MIHHHRRCRAAWPGGLFVLLALATIPMGAQESYPDPYPDPADRVLTHREQNALVTPWIRKRFDTILPGLMSREGIDMWIIPTREYNEDPVFASMSPLTTFASRRRTILVFFNPGGGKPVERYSVGRFDYDKLYTVYPTSNDGQWEGLRQLVEDKQPKAIGINESDAWNHADGISANEKRHLMDALGPTYAGRVIHMPKAAPHAGPNYAIQGTARELLIDALLRWEQTPWGHCPLMPVHDEILAMVPQDEAHEATAALKECMATELYGVPIVAEADEPSFEWKDSA